MKVDRRRFLTASLTAAAAATLAPARAAASIEETSIVLWPGSAPGGPPPGLVEKVVERSPDPAIADRAVSGILDPCLHVFRPAHPNGAAVVIMPGGGYRRIVIDKEGDELGRWLSARALPCRLTMPSMRLTTCQRAPSPRP